MSGAENPPAFPVPEVRMDGFGISEGSAGMTLRDWFAGQALPSAFNHARHNVEACTSVGRLPEEWAAQMAYGLADAMLAARQQEQSHEA